MDDNYELIDEFLHEEISNDLQLEQIDNSLRKSRVKDVKMMQKKRKLSHKDVEYKRLLTNSRERIRQQNLNTAFQLLRNIVPTYPADAKLSKYSILKSAIRYIIFLQDLITDMGKLRIHEQESKYLEKISETNN